MQKLSFRTLKAAEIDCRISTVSQKGISLLLYKDARVDQNILDETVGPMNWQRSHSRDNANCTVSLWDDEKQQWISKEDTGTEVLLRTVSNVPALTGGSAESCTQHRLSGLLSGIARLLILAEQTSMESQYLPAMTSSKCLALVTIRTAISSTWLS